MKLHIIYLQTYIAASHGKDYTIGSTNASQSELSSVAIAVHDALRGRGPKTIDALLAAISGMTSEAVVAAVDSA